MSVGDRYGSSLLSTQYLCKKWIHTRYSSVRGNMSLVVDGYRCKQCDGTFQEADLAEMMDGKTYGIVKRFFYMGDTLDGDGGADLAVTARIRNG